MEVAKAAIVMTVSMCCLLSFSRASPLSPIGLNYGRLGNNLPSPYESIQHILSMKAGHVKLYDANPEVLKLLSGTKLHITVMVPNDQISTVASNQSHADVWVQRNVLAYYPNTKIRFVLVGNEVFSYNDPAMWLDLVPAMRKIKKSLSQSNIHNIKVGTPVAMDVLTATFPPSSGEFRSSIPNRVIVSLLEFLHGTKSHFFIDVYPYFPWSANPENMSLDFALLGGNATYEDPQTGLVYTNLLDQMLDSAVFAMRKLGFDDIPITIAETGWPHAGDVDQIGANPYNAAAYNRNLAKKMTVRPPLGTPARPGVEIPTFVFSLYDENRKPGPGTERHWGLLDSNGTPIYEVDLTGVRPDSEYPPLPPATNNEPYRGKIWCVAEPSASAAELGAALDHVCGQSAICDVLAPGKECYEPVSVAAHASYAFSAYWAEFRSSGGDCYFNGLAVQTVVDPSHGSCRFPSVLV